MIVCCLILMSVWLAPLLIVDSPAAFWALIQTNPKETEALLLPRDTIMYNMCGNVVCSHIVSI